MKHPKGIERMSVTNGTREREGTIEGGWVRSSEREGTSDGETDGGPKKGGLVLVTVKASWGRRIYCGRMRSHKGRLEPE